jgi:hypothetical protein
VIWTSHQSLTAGRTPGRAVIEVRHASKSEGPEDRCSAGRIAGVTGSSSGGLGPVRGTALEARVLAWLACYLLADRRLPQEWMTSAEVSAVGGQTGREVDDLGGVTKRGGYLLIQSKKRLGLGVTPTSPLGQALRQVVAQFLHGVPADPEDGTAVRELDPSRDRLIVVTDEIAPGHVKKGLVDAVDRLACLPSELPFADLDGDADFVKARDVVLGHLRREWTTQRGELPTDAALRPLLKVLRVRVAALVEGGREWDQAMRLLEEVLANQAQSRAAWAALVTQCVTYAEKRLWAVRSAVADDLAHQEIYLGSDRAFERDIANLRTASRSRLSALDADIHVPAAEGKVRLAREIQPIIDSTDGNLVLVGPAGAGKTSIIVRAARALAGAGQDVLFLPADALAGTAADAQTDLGISYGLLDVVLAWRGPARGTVIIDGLDVTKLSEPSRWLLELVRGLRDSRWRVLATARTYSLRYGPRWREAFRGSPPDPNRQDRELSGVRHLLVSDLTDSELAPLAASSPSLAALVSSAHPALMSLLRNPFNLKLAADMLAADPSLPLTSIRTRNDLLRQYWDQRVVGQDRYRRQATLTALATQMIRDRRPRVADPAAILDPALHDALEGLLADDVLREDPRDPWATAAATGFSHPILFDYAVAQLVLGRPGQPMYLLDRLAEDPDLAVITKPSLDLHLSAIWHGDPTRNTFWALAVRLDQDGRGHALAGLAAAAVSVHEGLAAGNLDPLLSMCCTARRPTQMTDARRLVAQIAGVMFTRDIPGPQQAAAIPVLAAAAGQIAASAEADDDVNLAQLATFITRRLSAASQSPEYASAAGQLDAATASTMRVALADPAGTGRADLARNAGSLLGDAVIRDPVAYSPLISRVCEPEALAAWNVIVIEQLIEKLPELGRVAPRHAAQIVLTAWALKATDDSPSQIGTSQILSFSMSPQGRLDSVRYQSGAKFSAWLTTAPEHAVEVYLQLLADHAPAWAITHPAGEVPLVRYSHDLSAGGGHGALKDMAHALVSYLTATAAQEGSGEETAVRLLRQLAADLTHEEVWRILLAAAAAAPTSLGIAFIPLLETGQLLEHPATCGFAAHLLTAVCPLLDANMHRAVERRVLAIGNRAAQDGTRFTAIMDTLIGCLDPARIQEPEIVRRLAVLRQSGGPPPPPLPPDPVWTRAFDISTDAPGPLDGNDEPLADAINAVETDLREAYNRGPGQESARQRLRESFPPLVAELVRSRGEPGSAHLRQGYEALCAAADILAGDPQITPDSELGSLILAVLIGVLPGTSGETETRQ